MKLNRKTKIVNFRANDEDLMNFEMVRRVMPGKKNSRILRELLAQAAARAKRLVSKKRGAVLYSLRGKSPR